MIKNIVMGQTFISETEKRRYFDKFPNELKRGLLVIVDKEPFLYDGNDWKLLVKGVFLTWKDVLDTKRLYGNYEDMIETAKSVGYSMIAFNGKVYDVNDPDMNAICDVEEVK